jgi:hypothetical protein
MSTVRKPAPRKPPVHPKVAATGAVGALTVMAVFIASEFGLVIPPDVAAALAILTGVAAGYLKGA